MWPETLPGIATEWNQHSGLMCVTRIWMWMWNNLLQSPDHRYPVFHTQSGVTEAVFTPKRQQMMLDIRIIYLRLCNSSMTEIDKNKREEKQFFVLLGDRNSCWEAVWLLRTISFHSSFLAACTKTFCSFQKKIKCSVHKTTRPSEDLFGRQTGNLYKKMRKSQNLCCVFGSLIFFWVSKSVFKAQDAFL